MFFKLFYVVKLILKWKEMKTSGTSWQAKIAKIGAICAKLGPMINLAPNMPL